MSAREWMYVSKPIVGPLRDGTTVIVEALLRGLDPRFSIRYFGAPEAPLRAAGSVLAAPAMGYAPSALAKARILAALFARGQRHLPLHLFFTPNRVTSAVLAGIRRVQPDRCLVQTVTSSHGAADHVGSLRRLDRVIVSSDHTARTLAGAGLPEDRLRTIFPGVASVAVDLDRPRPLRVLYAGDLDETVVARLGAIAERLATAPGGHALTVATRPKGPNHAAHTEALARALAGPIAAGRAEILGEVADMDRLLRDSVLQLYVADHVRNKVDLPLVVLEGLARGVGLVSVASPTLDEIHAAAERGGAPVGARIRGADPWDAAEAVARALESPATLRGWSAAAHELASSVFSRSAMIAAHERMYDELHETTR